MAVQQRRVSKTRKNKRRSHHALEAACTNNCSNCGKPVVPHRVCASCQFYNGKSINENRPSFAEKK